MNTHDNRHIKGKIINKYRYIQKARKKICIIPFMHVSRAGHVAIVGIYEFFSLNIYFTFSFFYQFISWLDFFTSLSDSEP